MKPVRRRELVNYLMISYKVSQLRSCRILCFSRSTHRYKNKADRRNEIRIRLKELASSRPSYGYRRLWILLRREGWLVNHKLVYRLYKEEGLGLRKKRPKRRVMAARREILPGPITTDQCWSMDFVHDQLYSGQPIKFLVIVDNFSRESLAIRAGINIKGVDVVEILDALLKQRGTPKSIRVDNGTEFTSIILDQWAYWNKVVLDFSRPGKPTDNAFIESFNSRFRQEFLNEHWFLSVSDAQERAETWRLDYNCERPHSSLGNISPKEFVRRRKLPSPVELVLCPN